jgi:fibronectin type 3 domain-containing protein
LLIVIVIEPSNNRMPSLSAKTIALLLLILPAFKVRALTNSLALTPPMGWNSWNYYNCGIDSAAVRAAADVVATNGMKAAGYQFINVDDCWASARNSNGIIQPEPSTFPEGMQALANYVHADGLKFGVYTDHGTATCGGRPGSYGYEYLDANTYASWGVDYLKDDNCNWPPNDVPQVDYSKMSQALMESGRPITFCICMGSPGYQSFDPGLANQWRTTDDINDSYSTMISHIDLNSQTAYIAGPGRWNDPDMLEIGNGGMTAAQDQTHFTMWCIMAAPLIMGNNLTAMTPQTMATLTNSEAIAVDQDPAGEQGVKVANHVTSTSTTEVWSKTLGYDFGTKAVVLFNRLGPATNITCYWTNVGLQAGTATVRDLWAHTNLGTFTNSFTAHVASNSAMMLKIVGAPPVLPVLGTNYLNQLQPVYAYTGWGAITNNINIAGNPIKLGGVTYTNGIGVNAFAGLCYDLGAICSRFQATIGLDDDALNQGASLQFYVFADGAQIYYSGVMTTNPPQAINLDLTGVHRLMLGVGDGDNNINYCHADWANALVTVTNATSVPPYAPTGLSATPGNPIRLVWSSTRSATNYNVQRAMVTNGPYTTIGTTPIAAFTDSNVVDGTTYFYVVSAVDLAGQSANSSQVAATACATASVPTGVTAVSTASQLPAVLVRWNAAAVATGYNVLRSTSGTPYSTAASGLATTNFTDTNVAPGAIYYYVISAVNACGQSADSTFVASGPVLVFATPTDLTEEAGSNQVNLNWVPSTATTGCNVKRSTTNGGPYAIIANNVPGTGYLDHAVTNGTTYYYVVSALNGQGDESSNSVQISATPMALAVSPYTAQVTSRNPIAYWPLNETNADVAYESIVPYNGYYSGVFTLGLDGPRPPFFPEFESNNYAAGFDGATASVLLPAMNLNTNVLTITAWINPSGLQSSWAGIFFCRTNSTVSGLSFGTGNELRYNWNNDANTFNWNSGLVPPQDQWSFVALVITPGQAAICMVTNRVTNSVISSATNVYANPAQAFDGGTFIGQDPYGGRFFNGELASIALYGRALSTAAISNLAAVGPTFSVTQKAIGIHFTGREWSIGGNTPEALTYSDTAGVVSQQNWNNVNPSGYNSGGMPQIIGPNAGVISDSSGAVTGVTFSYAAQGMWSVDQSTWTGNQQLLNGYSDVEGSGNGQYTMGGIPFHLYDVYLYLSSDTDGRTAGVNINGGLQTYVLTDANGYDYSNPLIQATATTQGAATSGHYVLYRYVAGSNLTANLSWYGENYGLAGIQIVPSKVWLTNSWNGSNLTLTWPGQGVLLQATNLNGPWATNLGAASPFAVKPIGALQFFRILVQ